MVKKWVQIKCKAEDRDILMGDCTKEFLNHHPEFTGQKLTQRFMLRKLINFYLDKDHWEGFNNG